MRKGPGWIALAAGGALAGAAGYAAYAAAWPSAQAWARGFHQGPRTGRALALTFDDGPSNETPRFLELLAAHRVQATFFVCGANVRERPAVVRKALAAGHEIGNHTFNHLCLLGLPTWRVREEVTRAQHAIEDATGVSPRLFRPPYGVRAPALRAVLEELGLLSVHWTVIGNDWKWSARRIAKRVLAEVGPGGVICLHDGSGTRPEADREETLKALRLMLPVLMRQEYQMVTADRMAAMLELRPSCP